MRRLLAAAALLAAAVSLSGPGQAAERPVRLLPDLAQSTPKRLIVTRVGDRWRLGFLSAAANVGRGPVLVRGRRSRASDPRMTARQLIRRSDGSTARGRRVGTLRYSQTRTHEHWHIRGFMRYELRDTRGRIVTPSRKVGFCLTDSAPWSRPVPRARSRPRWTTRCGLNRPDLLRVDEGISVGWMDIYDPFVEGQYVDVTGLPAGRYVLVHRVNPSGRIRALARSNNASSALVRLRWPNGRSRKPAVKRLAACFYRARCSR